MKTISFLTLVIVLCSRTTFAQTDSTYNIKAWGSEPFWTFEFVDTLATCSSIYGDDSTKIYSLSEHINNAGFTNESVDTYIFTSTKNESLMLILVKNEDCNCGYDMSDGESKISAYIYITLKQQRVMLLGCAKIISKK